MPRQRRAIQFAPFDALKGLQNALRLKEYERERYIKGDIQPEKIEEISKVLLSLTKESKVFVYYYSDNYYRSVIGKAKVDIYNQTICVEDLKIKFTDIFDIREI